MKSKSESIIKKGGDYMPKAICKKCGKAWCGWALKFKICFCDCGEKLEMIKEGNKNGKG